MRRARLLSLCWLCAAPPFAQAAEIALLKSSDTPGWRPTIEAFRRAAAPHTVIEFDLRGDRGEADNVIAGLRGKAAALVALGPLAGEAARAGAPEIPLVVCMVADPERIGLEPSAGVTGVALHPPVMNQLAAFRAVNPRGINIGVLYNPENTGKYVEQARRSSSVVRLRIVDKPVASAKEVPQALRALLGGPVPVDALWVPPDPMLLADETRRFLLAEMLKAQKPIYSSSSVMVPEGALVSDGAELQSIGEQAAELVGRLLGPDKGARIEFAIPRGELIVNKKVAERLKIEIPAELLKSAAKVY